MSTGRATFDKAWPVAKLSKVAQPNPRKIANTSEATAKVHFVPMAAVGTEFGGIDVSSTRPLSEVSKGYTQFIAGDVLFAKITPCMENGKLAVVPELEHKVGFGSTEFHVLRPESSTSAKWIAHYISQQSFRKSAARNMSGSAGQLRVPAGWLADQEIPLPLPEIQEQVIAKIEELFSDLDAGIASLVRAREKLKRYRATILKSAVEGRLTEAWSKQHPPGAKSESGPALLSRILKKRRARWEAAQREKFAKNGKPLPKDWQDKYPEAAPHDTSGLPALPADWCWTSIGQCFHVAVGATPSRKEPAYWNGGIPWVSSGEVQFCRIRETRETISLEGESNSSTSMNPAGSVLLGMIGEGKTRGQTAILDIAACNNQNCAAIRVTETPVLSEYVYYWFAARYEETRATGSGNNQQALNKSLVEAIPFPLPSVVEQQEIVNQAEAILSSIDHSETEIKTALIRATRLKQAVLKRAFEGRLV